MDRKNTKYNVIFECVFENTLLLLLFTSRNNTFLGKLLLATLKKKGYIYFDPHT